MFLYKATEYDKFIALSSILYISKSENRKTSSYNTIKG